MTEKWPQQPTDESAIMQEIFANGNYVDREAILESWAEVLGAQNTPDSIALLEYIDDIDLDDAEVYPGGFTALCPDLVSSANQISPGTTAEVLRKYNETRELQQMVVDPMFYLVPAHVQDSIKKQLAERSKATDDVMSNIRWPQ